MAEDATPEAELPNTIELSGQSLLGRTVDMIDYYASHGRQVEKLTITFTPLTEAKEDADASDEKLLPVVTRDTFGAIHAEMAARGGDAYTEEILNRIAEENENPRIAEFIVGVIQLPEFTREFRRATVYAGCMVYRLLESQAEADRMNAEMRDSPS